MTEGNIGELNFESSSQQETEARIWGLVTEWKALYNTGESELKNPDTYWLDKFEEHLIFDDMYSMQAPELPMGPFSLCTEDRVVLGAIRRANPSQADALYLPE